MADEREELLALGAAGALTPDEAAELERLLAADPRAAAEYAAMVEGIAVLADSVAEEPPTRLRAAVLEAIAAEPRIGADAPPPGEPAEAAPPPPPPGLAPVVPIHRRRWWIPATAVAAAIVLVVGALVVTRDADAPTDDDMMAAVLDDDDAVTVVLTGPAGELRLVKSDEHDATVLVGDGIDAPDAEQVLQLWAIADGQPASMGTFVPEDDGHVALVMEGTEPEGVQYAVSIEPEGGSEQPTGDIVAGPA
jgi:anti-sigma-K factor RskA